MTVCIRKEKAEDSSYVFELVNKSFKNENTMLLTKMLKKRKDFIEDLSLVSEVNGIIIGHILLSPISIHTKQSPVKTLWLEPICVDNHFQNKGIGTLLIINALNMGKKLGFKSVFVVGSQKYYSRFGFKEAMQFGITPSLPIKSEAFLAIELTEGGLRHQGELIYPQEIFD